MKYRVIFTFDDGDTEEIGDFDTEAEAEDTANFHEYMCNPFMREHCEYKIKVV
jgi:hypothetical protein